MTKLITKHIHLASFGKFIATNEAIAIFPRQHETLRKAHNNHQAIPAIWARSFVDAASFMNHSNMQLTEVTL